MPGQPIPNELKEKGLETQINIWETFIVNSTNVNQDDAMLFP